MNTPGAHTFPWCPPCARGPVAIRKHEATPHRRGSRSVSQLRDARNDLAEAIADEPERAQGVTNLTQPIRVRPPAHIDSHTGALRTGPGSMVQLPCLGTSLCCPHDVPVSGSGTPGRGFHPRTHVDACDRRIERVRRGGGYAGASRRLRRAGPGHSPSGQRSLERGRARRRPRPPRAGRRGPRSIRRGACRVLLRRRRDRPGGRGRDPGAARVLQRIQRSAGRPPAAGAPRGARPAGTGASPVLHQAGDRAVARDATGAVQPSGGHPGRCAAARLVGGPSRRLRGRLAAAADARRIGRAVPEAAQPRHRLSGVGLAVSPRRGGRRRAAGRVARGRRPLRAGRRLPHGSDRVHQGTPHRPAASRRQRRQRRHRLLARGDRAVPDAGRAHDRDHGGARRPEAVARDSPPALPPGEIWPAKTAACGTSSAGT